MKRTLIASGIPAINKRPLFVLHSYRTFQTIVAVKATSMKKYLSLYELLCKTFGIYLSLGAGNGFINLGSQDMDVSIDELGKHLIANDPEKTLSMHLNSLEVQDKLVSTFIKKFETLIPQQKKLPIMIDESQVAINLYKEHFSTTQTCGTGMSFDDIKIHADATYMNFVDFMNIHLQCPYGFAQLCIFKRLADLNTFEMDAITVRIVEPIPILTFKEYLKKAGPDLVCIVQSHTPNGIVEVPLFLQARLVKDSSGVTAKRTTDPHHFYSLGDKQTNLKKEVKRRSA
ncbi:16601_t:CDS:2 [Rhizophagus irregularis]|nr:16601_t:CDS:2 [Rhizophagus irregularis]